MAANPDLSQHFFTLDEYFALEHAGDARYEYWDGEIVCMSGGSVAHGQIAGNVFYQVRQKIEGRDCQAFTADTAIKTPSVPPYRYPDASVVCDEPEFESVRGVDVLLNPTLIVEVLSPTSERRDREGKFTAYKVIPTFREYLLIDQQKPLVTCYRQVDKGEWVSEEVAGLEKAVHLESIDGTIPLADIYRNVRFDS